jgi:hypothetical protein
MKIGKEDEPIEVPDLLPAQPMPEPSPQPEPVEPEKVPA